jgi:hypothetical protein
MPIRATAVIIRESRVDARTHRKSSHAALYLLNEAGKEFAVPRYFSGFPEVADLLKREARVTQEQLQGCSPRYEKGEELRISLTLKNDEVIKNLGFDPKAA